MTEISFKFFKTNSNTQNGGDSDPSKIKNNGSLNCEYFSQVKWFFGICEENFANLNDYKLKKKLKKT